MFGIFLSTSLHIYPNQNSLPSLLVFYSPTQRTHTNTHTHTLHTLNFPPSKPSFLPSTSTPKPPFNSDFFDPIQFGIANGRARNPEPWCGGDASCRGFEWPDPAPAPDAAPDDQAPPPLRIHEAAVRFSWRLPPFLHPVAHRRRSCRSPLRSYSYQVACTFLFVCCYVKRFCFYFPEFCPNTVLLIYEWMWLYLLCAGYVIVERELVYFEWFKSLGTRIDRFTMFLDLSVFIIGGGEDRFPITWNASCSCRTLSIDVSYVLSIVEFFYCFSSLGLSSHTTFCLAIFIDSS